MMMGERRVGLIPVRYYLLEERSPEGKADYGLRLTVPGGDSSELRGVTFSLSAIRRLLGRLMRCDVTPMSLRDIVDDWLISEYLPSPDRRCIRAENGNAAMARGISVG